MVEWSMLDCFVLDGENSKTEACEIMSISWYIDSDTSDNCICLVVSTPQKKNNCIDIICQSTKHPEYWGNIDN